MMKKKLSLVLALVLIMTGCDVMECENVQSSEVTFLIDISDPKLFEEASDDIKSNLSKFMSGLGLAAVGECQQLTVNIAPLSARDELKMSSETIGVNQQGLSRKQVREMSNPRPIIQMISRSLSEYDGLKELDDYNSGSSIGNQILKAMLQMKGSGQSTLVIISDLISHDERFSLYKRIPSEIDTEVMESVFDARLLDEFSRTYSTAEAPSITLVQLQAVESHMRAKRGALASFWKAVLAEGLGQDVTIVDNLSH